MALDDIFVILLPATAICPAVARTNPDIVRNNVVLPALFGPSNATQLPLATRNVAS